MTYVDLRAIKIRSGEQFRDAREIELDPVALGGQLYAPTPERPEAALVVSRLSSGLLFELEFEAGLAGPCFRCLTDARFASTIRGREYQANDPGEADELQTPYVSDERLDLSSWARDALVLALPEKILCRADCAGLCAVCGKDLNLEPHEHSEEESDPRWAALAELKDRL